MIDQEYRDRTAQLGIPATSSWQKYLYRQSVIADQAPWLWEVHQIRYKVAEFIRTGSPACHELIKIGKMYYPPTRKVVGIIS